jgi:hypothetical protein
VLAALFVTSQNPHPASAAQERPKDERPKGVTRTYDLYDFFWYTEDGSDSQDTQGTRKALSDSLVSLVKETVEPGTWEGADAVNSVEERDGRLIVTAPTGVHASLDNILGQLRESTMVQGVSLDCHFILADEAFLKGHAPAALARKQTGASVRGIGPFKAKSIVEAARETPGVVVVPAPPLPLYSLSQSMLIGEERKLKLPRIGPNKGAEDKADAVEVSRPAGLSMAVSAIAGARRVTLDLTARSGTLEAGAGEGGAPGGFDETEGLFHGTFAVERSGAFLVRAPLVRAKLAGVRGGAGAGKEAQDQDTEVVREVAAAQPDPPRYLLIVGTVRSMTPAELTLLAGARVAKLIEGRFGGDEAPAPKLPAPPGVVPPPPPPPRLPAQSTRVYDLRALLLGSERGAERAPARAKRLEQVMARLKAAINDDKVPLRETYGQLIVTAGPTVYERITAVLDELSAERLVETD